MADLAVLACETDFVSVCGASLRLAIKAMGSAITSKKEIGWWESGQGRSERAREEAIHGYGW